MPPEDEAAQQPTEDTANEAAAEEATPAESTEDSQPAVNWQERYENLHPEYTRATQQLSEFEQFYEDLRDPDTRDEALAALGIDPDDEEYEDDEDWDDDERDPRVDDIEHYLSLKAEEEQMLAAQEAEFDHLETSVEGLEKELGYELSDKELEAVVDLADVMRDEQGLPDIQGAWDTLKGASEAQRERYLKSKQAAKVDVGQAGTEKVDLADDDERIKHMAALMQAGAPENAES